MREKGFAHLFCGNCSRRADGRGRQKHLDQLENAVKKFIASFSPIQSQSTQEMTPTIRLSTAAGVERTKLPQSCSPPPRVSRATSTSDLLFFLKFSIPFPVRHTRMEGEMRRGKGRWQSSTLFARRKFRGG